MTTPTDVATQLELSALVAKFANSLDLKDWQGLADCLADTLHTDYFEMRGTPPEDVTREQFIEPRKIGLKELKTHHLAGNLEISATGSTAEVKASMAVVLQTLAGEITRIHCVYFFGATKSAGSWRFHSIRQKMLIK